VTTLEKAKRFAKGKRGGKNHKFQEMRECRNRDQSLTRM